MNIIIIITLIIIHQFIYNYLIGLYVKEERLHNPCGFVSDLFKKLQQKIHLKRLSFSCHEELTRQHGVLTFTKSMGN